MILPIIEFSNILLMRNISSFLSFLYASDVRGSNSFDWLVSYGGFRSAVSIKFYQEFKKDKKKLYSPMAEFISEFALLTKYSVKMQLLDTLTVSCIVESTLLNKPSV